jgi:CheY-like chemotaxis protein
MRVLVLDDDKLRHKVFQQNLIGNEFVVHAYTVDQAVEWLKKEKFDVVYLDHDLNDHPNQATSLDYATGGYGGPRELTGLDVAYFMSRMPKEKHPEYVIVHSYNAGGAANMMAVLKTMESKVIRQIFGANSGSGWT